MQLSGCRWLLPLTAILCCLAGVAAVEEEKLFGSVGRAISGKFSSLKDNASKKWKDAKQVRHRYCVPSHVQQTDPAVPFCRLLKLPKQRLAAIDLGESIEEAIRTGLAEHLPKVLEKSPQMVEEMGSFSG
jgi:hypothetical protein